MPPSSTAVMRLSPQPQLTGLKRKQKLLRIFRLQHPYSCSWQDCMRLSRSQFTFPSTTQKMIWKMNERMAFVNMSPVLYPSVGSREEEHYDWNSNTVANEWLVLWMTSIRLHCYYDSVQKEGGGGGTHILYVRYIILLQNARQTEQRKEEITQVERWRVRTGWKQADT